MAVRSKEELLEVINKRFPDDTSEETLGLIEDISDTYDNLYANKSEDWKTKYEELDASWKKKYRDRFFHKDEDAHVQEEKQEEYREDEGKVIKTYNDLFSEEEVK